MSMRPLLATVLLTTIILIYFPAIVYRENADFFETSFRHISLLLFPAGILLTTLLWSFSLFLSEKWKERYAVVITSLALTGWFIGVFLVFKMGLLDGQQQIQSDSVTYQWSEFIAALLGVGALIASGLRWPRVYRKAAIFLLFVMAGVVLITIVMDKKKYEMQRAPENMLRASSQKNVFVFVFDTFQSDVFDAILKDHPALARDLEGFTFFRNTASVAPTTYLSMPAIHSATLYHPKQSIPECYEEAIRKNSFLARLSSAGYETSMINSIGPCPKGASCGKLGQVTGNSWSPILRDASELIDISCYRFVPALFKPAIYNSGKWLISGASRMHRIFPNIEFLKNLSERLFPLTERPVARFIHSYVTHPPALVNSDCEFIDPQKWKWNNVKAQSECSVNLFVDFIRKLKEKDLYDRSLILLLSDHGAGLMTGRDNIMIAKAKALLLIKPFQSKGDLKTSNKLMHIGDVPKTVCRLTGDCAFEKGEFAYTDVSGTRSVPFLEYRWKHQYWYTKVVPIDAVWRISGRVEDIFSWNRETSPQELTGTNLDFSRLDPAASFGFGWSPPAMMEDRSIRRAGQQFAQIFLPLKQHQKTTINATIISHGKRPGKPSMVLYADHNRVGEVAVPSDWDAVRFDVPGEFITNPVTRLTFEFNNSQQTKRKRGRNAVVIFDAVSAIE